MPPLFGVGLGVLLPPITNPPAFDINNTLPDPTDPSLYQIPAAISPDQGPNIILGSTTTGGVINNIA